MTTELVPEIVAVDAVVAGNVAAACAALRHHHEKIAQIILRAKYLCFALALLQR